MRQENGCKNRKCPCRNWINCKQYVDETSQLMRLQRKEYDFFDWYKNNFRVEPEMGEMSNG